MFERAGLGSIKRRTLHDDDVMTLFVTSDGVELQDVESLSGCAAVGSVDSRSGGSAAFAAVVIILSLIRLRSSRKRAVA